MRNIVYGNEASAQFTWGVWVYCPTWASVKPAAVLWSTKCVRLLSFQADPPATMPQQSYCTHTELLGPRPGTKGLVPEQRGWGVD